ncbi:hypothetical protein MPSEU_000985900 [Mayamaea pseudoterrestris]|nr:hypothetical protein MPSEU_000985900 [Mayamaea pseudoterrestris]
MRRHITPFTLLILLTHCSLIESFSTVSSLYLDQIAAITRRRNYEGATAAAADARTKQSERDVRNSMEETQARFETTKTATDYDDASMKRPPLALLSTKPLGPRQYWGAAAPRQSTAATMTTDNVAGRLEGDHPMTPRRQEKELASRYDIFKRRNAMKAAGYLGSISNHGGKHSPKAIYAPTMLGKRRYRIIQSNGFLDQLAATNVVQSVSTSDNDGAAMADVEAEALPLPATRVAPATMIGDAAPNMHVSDELHLDIDSAIKYTQEAPFSGTTEAAVSEQWSAETFPWNEFRVNLRVRQPPSQAPHATSMVVNKTTEAVTLHDLQHFPTRVRPSQRVVRRNITAADESGETDIEAAGVKPANTDSAATVKALPEFKVNVRTRASTRRVGTTDVSSNSGAAMLASKQNVLARNASMAILPAFKVGIRARHVYAERVNQQIILASNVTNSTASITTKLIELSASTANMATFKVGVRARTSKLKSDEALNLTESNDADSASTQKTRQSASLSELGSLYTLPAFKVGLRVRASKAITHQSNATTVSQARGSTVDEKGLYNSLREFTVGIRQLRVVDKIVPVAHDLQLSHAQESVAPFRERITNIATDANTLVNVPSTYISHASTDDDRDGKESNVASAMHTIQQSTEIDDTLAQFVANAATNPLHNDQTVDKPLPNDFASLKLSSNPVKSLEMRNVDVANSPVAFKLADAASGFDVGTMQQREDVSDCVGQRATDGLVEKTMDDEAFGLPIQSIYDADNDIRQRNDAANGVYTASPKMAHITAETQAADTAFDSASNSDSRHHQLAEHELDRPTGFPTTNKNRLLDEEGIEKIRVINPQSPAIPATTCALRDSSVNIHDPFPRRAYDEWSDSPVILSRADSASSFLETVTDDIYNSQGGAIKKVDRLMQLEERLRKLEQRGLAESLIIPRVSSPNGMQMARGSLITEKIAGAATPSVAIAGKCTKLEVHGGSLKTWSYAHPSVKRIHVVLMTEGRPLHADVALWQGPSNTPCKMRIFCEDGAERPFSTVIETPNSPNTISIRNSGNVELPLSAQVLAEDVGNLSSLPSFPNCDLEVDPVTIQGGAVRTYPFETIVESVQIVLQSDGRPLYAQIEILQGPSSNKQVVDVYTEDGTTRPFFMVVETPGNGNAVRIVNSGSIEFPFVASVQPFTFGILSSSIEPVIGGDW